MWSGYRETEDRTSANVLLQADIWQAGADPDRLLIGFSCSDDRTVYMSTIHVAHPGQRDRSEVAPGLAVLTSPAERKPR